MAHRAVIAMRYWAVHNAMYHCRSEFESSVTNTVMNSVKWSKSSGYEPLGFLLWGFKVDFPDSFCLVLEF